MTDDGKKAYDDLTLPVATTAMKPAFTPDRATDEADAVTFIGERLALRPAGASGDTGKPPEPSFDDDLAARPVQGRLARTRTPLMTPQLREGPKPVDVVDGFAAPSDTSQFMQAVFNGDATSPAVVPVSSADRAEPDEPTHARDPDLTRSAAPVMNADDVESVVTAPMPMMAGLHPDQLRNDDVSLPQPRPILDEPIGDGIEREAAPAASTADAPVDHTPAFAAGFDKSVHTDAVRRLADDTADVEVTEPVTLPRKSSTALIIALSALALVVIGALVVVVLMRAELLGVRPAVAEITPPSTTPPATLTPPSATPPVSPPPATPSPPPASTPPPATAPTTTPPATATPATATTANATSAYVAPVYKRAADGFGPFGDRSGQGLGAILGSNVRAIVGSAIADTSIGVRGDIRRVDVSKKDKTVSVECSLSVFDKSGGRATLGANARAGDAKAAADACAKSLDADLKAAVARAH